MSWALGADVGGEEDNEDHVPYSPMSQEAAQEEVRVLGMLCCLLCYACCACCTPQLAARAHATTGAFTSVEPSVMIIRKAKKDATSHGLSLCHNRCYGVSVCLVRLRPDTAMRSCTGAADDGAV